MSLPTRQNWLSSSKYPIKAPYTMKFDYITVHETGNNAPAINESNYMINNNYEVGFHVAIDDKEAVESIMFARNAWHCGDGNNGTGNRKSIGIEICYQTESYPMTKYKKSVDNAILYIADVLHENKKPVSCLRRHKDWNGKDCPRNINAGRYINWNEFKNRVQKRLDVLNGVQPPKPPTSSDKYKDKIKRSIPKDAIGVFKYWTHNTDKWDHSIKDMRTINVYKADKLEKTAIDGNNDKITIGTTGARNTFNMDGKKTGYMHEKGRTLNGTYFPK